MAKEMSKPHELTPDALYDSAVSFARTALDAYHSGESRRVALDACTALEHLAKACLASRSPALLTEFRGESKRNSLLQLLGLPEGKPLQLRTVGLRAALNRAKTFVSSKASSDALETLVELRDGAVHIGNNIAVEETLLVAFVQFAESLLLDLGRNRTVFWGNQLTVVDALLAEASDNVAHRVSVKMEAAKQDLTANTVVCPIA
jgi:hypothetical protein